MKSDKPRKKVRLLQRDTGKWCLVYFDDIGTVQALIVNVYEDGYFDAYITHDNTLSRLSNDQLVSIGQKVKAPRME